jgi:Ca2+-binding EF-hand superfamily protein
VQEFAQLHHFISQCQGSFYAFDRDNSKHLSPDELAQALQQAGEDMNISSPTL